MNIALLLLITGGILIYFIARYEKNNNKAEDILRANKNVPPLFMLRSAELKVNAIKAALNNPATAMIAGEHEVAKMQKEFESLLNGYKNREITLAAYYSKLGALLISVNELRGVPAEAELS